MTVSATASLTLTVTEKSEISLDDVTSPATFTSIIPAGLLNLSGTTTPAITRQFGSDIQLTGGSAQVDLTAIDKGDLPNEDWTGLKIELMKVKAADANTDSVSIESLAPNGYDILGPSKALSIPPGGEMLFRLSDQGDVIGPTDKDLEFNSADDDAIISVQLVAG